MPKLPEALPKSNVLAAINYLDEGKPHAFADSTHYDLLHADRRYPPKAVAGIAAFLLTGKEYGPKDFSGGLGSKCFRLLKQAGFDIVAKHETPTYPDEIDEDEAHFEGSVTKVMVNRYERSPEARKKCIAHYGARCAACDLDFGKRYGSIGEGFIHVHHLTPISEIKKGYEVNPITDLRPVCPNCHAMLHRKSPPFSIEELKVMVSA